MIEFTGKLWDYITDHTTPSDNVLNELYRETNLKVLNPQMLSGAYQGKFLEILCKIINPLHVLEIGTYTGYSAICLAKGLAHGGKVHTIEKNDEVITFAKKYFEKAGLDDKIEIYTGEAVDIIPELNYTFDLVFIDGDKEQYIEYYNLIFPKVRKGGVILADNVLWYGKVVADNKQEDIETSAIKRFNEFVVGDRQVEQVILPIRDGLTIIRKLS